MVHRAFSKSMQGGPWRRLLSGAFANLVGKLWVLGVQLVTIPVLTRMWGAEGFGIWLMLSTIPTYVALSDFGLGTAAGVDITSKVSKGKYDEALEAFQSVWVFLTSVVVILAVCAFVYATYTYLHTEADSDRFHGASLAAAILLMTLYSAIIVQMSILNVLYRATHKYALGTLLLDCMMPIEGAAMVIFALLGGALWEVALAMLLIRAAGYGFYYLILHRYEPWIRIGWAHATVATFKRLANPSLAALSLTLASSLALQGVVLTLGWSVGPAAVAVFAATRLLTRIPLQFSGLVMRASLPELTRADVARDTAMTRRLLTINVLSSMVVTVPFLLALVLFGDRLLNLLSGGHLEAPWALFVLLGLAATFNAVWTAASSALIAINQQARFSYWYLLFSTIVVLVPLFAWADGPIAVAIAMILSEVATGLVVMVAIMGNMAGIARQDMN